MIVVTAISSISRRIHVGVNIRPWWQVHQLCARSRRRFLWLKLICYRKTPSKSSSIIPCRYVFEVETRTTEWDMEDDVKCSTPAEDFDLFNIILRHIYSNGEREMLNNKVILRKIPNKTRKEKVLLLVIYNLHLFV